MGDWYPPVYQRSFDKMECCVSEQLLSNIKVSGTSSSNDVTSLSSCHVTSASLHYMYIMKIWLDTIMGLYYGKCPYGTDSNKSPTSLKASLSNKRPGKPEKV